MQWRVNFLFSCRTYLHMHENKGLSDKFTHLVMDLFSYVLIYMFIYIYNEQWKLYWLATSTKHNAREVVFFLLKCELCNMFKHLHITECQQHGKGEGNGGFRGLCVLWHCLWMTIAPPPFSHILLPLEECQLNVFTLPLHWSQSKLLKKHDGKYLNLIAPSLIHTPLFTFLSWSLSYDFFPLSFLRIDKHVSVSKLVTGLAVAYMCMTDKETNYRSCSNNRG